MLSSVSKTKSLEIALRMANPLATEGDADTAVHVLSLFRRDTPEQPSFIYGGARALSWLYTT